MESHSVCLFVSGLFERYSFFLTFSVTIQFVFHLVSEGGAKPFVGELCKEVVFIIGLLLSQ